MAKVPTFGELAARRRSVENVPAPCDDTMNVWQTLEVISGINLRKNYHYEGYSDPDNLLRTLPTPSHRLDSYPDIVTTPKSAKVSRENNDEKNDDFGASAKDEGAKRNRDASVINKKKRRKSSRIAEELAEKEMLLSLDSTDIVQCSFNIPRISGRLERLMGTHVVRLTDRKYMKELRQRIDEDYRVQLSNRIRTREIKELERERNLILEGKTDTVPDELSTDPIFVVNQRANVEITKRRAKLKTNRERNADRLLRQGLKWERERLRYDRQEMAKLREQARARAKQKALEEQYITEDATRGLDLLRIKDQEWQECEQSLRDFLRSERNKMKARSWAIPTPYSSDPLDLRNVIIARKRERERAAKEKAMRELEAQKSAAQLTSKRSAYRMVKRMTSAMKVFPSTAKEEVESVATVYLDDDEASDLPTSTISIVAPTEDVDKIKAQRSKEMQEQMNHDERRGFLVSADQYANLRYEDPQIVKLRNAKCIRDLYQVAERIIICEVEEEVIPTEEIEIEDEDDF